MAVKNAGKVVKMQDDDTPAVRDLIIEARGAENNGNNEAAISRYEAVLKSDSLNENAYDRLMILFRRAKDKKKELQIIEAGIRAFEKFYKSKETKSKKISELSKKLNKSIGLIDKKGQNLYDPEPIARWKKRKAVVEKRKGK